MMNFDKILAIVECGQQRKLQGRQTGEWQVLAFKIKPGGVEGGFERIEAQLTGHLSSDLRAQCRLGHGTSDKARQLRQPDQCGQTHFLAG